MCGWLVNLLDVLPGWKTVVAGVGLIALGVYNLSQGDFASAMQNISLGLAALGLRLAINRGN